MNTKIDNDTTTSYNFFPHLKKATAALPMDQKAKLLAMHRAGKANAGIYVGIVLAIYTILLTILLCRYARRQRSSSSSSSAREVIYKASCCKPLSSCFTSNREEERGGVRGELLEISVEGIPLNQLNNSSSTPL